jgi:hypothetical protein
MAAIRRAAAMAARVAANYIELILNVIKSVTYNNKRIP